MPRLLRCFTFLVVQAIALKVNKYFVYEWPEIAGSYSKSQTAVLINSGAGPLLNGEHGIYDTWQFSLFKLMFERSLVDHRRTLDPANATTFIIPYDFGIDACFRKDNGNMRRTKCPQAEAVTRKLVHESPYFNQSFGHNHLLIVSVNQNMNYFLDAKECEYFLSRICANCTKVAIDEYSFLHTRRKPIISRRGNYWHAVPFPSNFHFSTNVSTLPWAKNETRTIIVSFTGSRGSYNPVSTKLRTQLTANCDAYSQVRRSDNMTTCSTQTFTGRQYTKEHIMSSMASRSIFCLQPPGDMPTRKSVFDSVLLGCIPVFFNKLTGPLMYTWHLGQRVWEHISLTFDDLAKELWASKKSWGDVAPLQLNGTWDPRPPSGQNVTLPLFDGLVDVVKVLVDIYDSHPDLVKRKQKILRQHAFKIQYSLPAMDTGQEGIFSHRLLNTAQQGTRAKHPTMQLQRNARKPTSGHVGGQQQGRGAGQGQGLGLLLHDAFDITMSNVLAIHAGQRPHNRTSDFMRCPGKEAAYVDWCESTNSTVDTREDWD